VEEARKLDLSLIERIDKFMALLSSEDERAGLTRFREVAARYRRHREDNQYRPLLAGQKETGLQGAKDGAPLYEAAVRELKGTIRAKQAAAQKTGPQPGDAPGSSSQSGSPGGSSTKSDDNVVDADFEVVDDDKKKS